MAGLVHICIGKQRTGKTTFCMERLEKSKLPKVIYDINGEYTKYYSEPFEDFNVFMDRIVDLKEHFILIEEATIFFSPRARVEEMISLLVRAAHAKNIIFLNFHDYSSIPTNIKNLVHYITIFKTNDNEKMVRAKIERDYVVEAWKKVNSSKNIHEKITLRLE
jgi:hypothetical protein